MKNKNSQSVDGANWGRRDVRRSSQIRIWVRSGFLSYSGPDQSSDTGIGVNKHSVGGEA